MTRVGIITFQNGFHRGACDYYPLFKWERELNQRKIKISFFDSHDDKRLYSQDVVCIDHRYYRELTVVKNLYSDRRFIVDTMDTLRAKDIKVILFDNGDGAGGRQWEFIEHVDVLVKKQILKDKSFYTKNFGKASAMPFIKDYKLNHFKEKLIQNFSKEFVPCPPDQVYKIRLGWNIGMLDYRYFPFSSYYPIGTNRLLNSFYKTPRFNRELANKTIESAFRGEIKMNKETYSYQRNKVVELFSQDKYPDYITGEVLPKNKYLKELRRSKTCVSPFGWGEVCYRDFEAIIAGCLLIKPDMDHLVTYPDIYKKNETYLPLKWDMSDLEETLNNSIEHYESLKKLIINAQQIYKDAITDSRRFIDHFKSLIY